METYAYYLDLHLDKVSQGRQRIPVWHHNTSKFVSEPHGCRCNVDALQDILDYINPSFTPKSGDYPFRLNAPLLISLHIQLNKAIPFHHCYNKGHINALQF